MTAEQARQQIMNAVSEAVELCRSKGLTATGKTYYGDKLLRECAEFNADVLLVSGAIKLGTENMDEEDYCAYGMCCETKVGMVKDEEIEAEIAAFKENVEKLLEEITTAPSPEKKIEEINARQEAEAVESMKEFDLEMKKMKLKLYGALGVLALIAIGIIVAGFLI